MMSNRYNISNIQHVQNKKIFFDANVLIYLFWATGSSWENNYANVYSRLNRQNNSFVVDFIVISEFINRAIRIEYDKYLDENNLTKRIFSFKKYRDCTNGSEAVTDVYTIVSTILNTFDVIEKAYSKNDISAMLFTDILDFSDRALVKICNENNFILLTNDKDFKNSNIDILSCNRNLY